MDVFLILTFDLQRSHLQGTGRSSTFHIEMDENEETFAVGHRCELFPRPHVHFLTTSGEGRFSATVLR